MFYAFLFFILSGQVQFRDVVCATGPNSNEIRLLVSSPYRIGGIALIIRFDFHYRGFVADNAISESTQPWETMQ
jgi:hypothetical protein